MASRSGQDKAGELVSPLLHDFLGLPHCRTTSIDDSGVPTYANAEQHDFSRECPRCGQRGAIHGWSRSEHIDRPVNGKPTVIRLKKWRLICKDMSCGVATFRAPEGQEEFTGNLTTRCRSYIESQCFKSPFNSVSRETGVPETTIRRIADELLIYLDDNFRIDTPVVLGIDDVCLPSGKDIKVARERAEAFPRRRHLCYRTVIVNSGTSQVVDVLEDRRAATVFEYLSKLPGASRVRYVTMDMSVTYRDAVWLALGVPIIIDRWHIAARANKVVDKARLKVRGERKRSAVSSFRAALLSRSDELKAKNPEKYQELLDLFRNFPELEAVYWAKERFLDIWKCRSRSAAETRYDRWVEDLDHHAAAAFQPLIKMISNWRLEVFNYWETGYLATQVDVAEYERLSRKVAAKPELQPLACRLSRRSQWIGPTNGRTEARNQIVRLANRIGRSYSFRFLRARAIYATYDVSEHFGVCDGCDKPFKRNPASRQRLRGVRIASYLKRGPGVLNLDPVAATCGACDPGSTGVTRSSGQPWTASARHCGFRDIWTEPESRIVDDPNWMIDVHSRMKQLRRRRRQRTAEILAEIEPLLPFSR